MNTDRIIPGSAELIRARRKLHSIFYLVFGLSMFVNLLGLTGSLYMLQVYDRVLSSRSVETLAALTLLVAFLFLMMGLLDYTRGRLLARAAARFQSYLEKRVFYATLKQSAHMQRGELPSAPHDLEKIHSMIASQAVSALCDIPWMPLYLFAMYILHPWLAILTAVGGVVLTLLTWMNQYMTRTGQSRALQSKQEADGMASGLWREAGVVRSLGMRESSFLRWSELRIRAVREQMVSTDLSGVLSSTSKHLRMLLQSAILGLGAYLSLRGEISPGSMIAAAVLMSRALAPIDQLLAQWQPVQQGIRAWQSLGELLEKIPLEKNRTELPRPAAKLHIEKIHLFPPGGSEPLLRNISVTVNPGEILAVIGPSGAGKSTLARAITGIWPVVSGNIRLDGASLDQYHPDTLGRYIGYLPQQVSLLQGTLAENIARLDKNPDAEKVIAAAKHADIHGMITGLPKGYDTEVSPSNPVLSGGQIQRLGLARALYDNPVLLVLDEPDSNLDGDGSEALQNAIVELTRQGSAVIIIAHRRSSIRHCDRVLVIENGLQTALSTPQEINQQQHNQRQKLAEPQSQEGKS